MKTTKIIYTLTVLTAITLGLNAKADEANNYAKQKQYEKSDLESILGTGIKNSKLTSKNPVHWEASKCEENIVDKSIKYGEKFKYVKVYDKHSYYTGSDINIDLDILSSSCTKIDQN
ncbi:MAG: hypothetical protein ACK41T_09935 [Pseudobdellovibrio sp.]